MNKIFDLYHQFSVSGEWHIHTNYSDGSNSVFEYADYALKNSIPLLIFTEHVREKLSYDFSAFLTDIDTAKRQYPQLIILSGCEAKVLPEGKLDCPQWIIDTVDYPMFSFHSFPQDVDIYHKALMTVFDNYDNLACWGHPGLFFKKYPHLKISDIYLEHILIRLKEKRIIFEKNLKYSLPIQEWTELYHILPGESRIVLGNDIHDLENIKADES